MTKDKIKEALRCCKNQCCSYCPHWCEKCCQYQTLSDALELITEQEQEIERLKANGYRSIMNAFENNRDKIVENIQTEIDDYKQSIKQAKIEVLNEVKKRIYDISPYNPLVTKDNVKYFIDKLIDEVQK